MKASRYLPNVITLLLAALMVVTQQVWASPLVARLAAPSVASSKTTVSYQGFLSDTSNNPVTAPVDMVFRLYNVATGGTALWAETQSGVAMTNGLFSVLLGSVTPLSPSLIANNNDLWLGITVGSDTEMLPREKLASAPFAMMADVPDGSITQYKLGDDSVTSAKIVDGAVTSNDVGFNFAAGTSKAGAATDIVCTACISGGEIAGNSITSAKIVDGAVTGNDVGFSFAAGTSKAGAATDLVCTTCISGDEIADNSVTSAKIVDGAVTSNDVGFNFAAGTSKAGAATDLVCTTCVSGGEIADNSVTSAKIVDGAVTGNDVGFNFAAGTSKAGAATDLVCTGCITDSDVADSSIPQTKFTGVRMWVGAIQVAVDANGQGCATFGLPSGRFTNTPDVFVIRRSSGAAEDSADYATTRFIETTARSTTSATICLNDDRMVSGSVGVAVLAVQAD